MGGHNCRVAGGSSKEGEEEMTIVKDMIKEWLTSYGYSGLYDSFGCGCGIEDLMPCYDICCNCMPGYRVPCDPDTNDGVDFITVPHKPKGREK